MSRSALKCQAFTSRLGCIAIAGRGSTLEFVTIGHASIGAALGRLAESFGADFDEGDWNEPLVERLCRYAEGEPVDFTSISISMDHLSAFQRAVVQDCRQIAYGQTLSYGELASRAGAPGAARAVGNVMAANRYPLVVPCHRVVAAGGALGGFSAPSGTRLKQRLLDMERAAFAVSTPA